MRIYNNRAILCRFFYFCRNNCYLCIKICIFAKYIYLQNMNIKYLVLYVTLLFLPLCKVEAQKNIYEINDRCYLYFMKSSSAIKSTASLSYADTMFSLGARLHDTKAQCLALTLKNMHYYYMQDEAMMIKTMHDTQRFAIKTPYKQYVFDPWNRLINYYANHERLSEALDQAKKYLKEAVRLNDSYGIPQGYRKLGDLYASLSDFDEALSQYSKALSLKKEMKNDRNINDIYIGMASTYCDTYRYDKAKYYYQKVIENNLNINIYMSYVGLFRAYAMEQLHPDSIEYYKRKCDQEFGSGMMSVSNTKHYYDALVYYYLNKDNYDKAFEYVDKLEPDETSIKLKALIYFCKGDYKNAYLNQSRFISEEAKKRINSNHNFITQLTVQLNKSNLEREKHALEMNNAIMKLQQSEAREKLMLLEKSQTTLELNNKQLALEKQKSNAERSELRSGKAELEAKNERVKALRQQDMTRYLTQQNRDRNNMMILAFLLLGVVMIFSSAYILLRQRQMKILKEEKDHVTDAYAIANEERDKAEKADKLKTIFLQNMSHEIRTPLNAIVGFNQILNSGIDYEITEEERHDMTESINNNAELLVKLVNDILDVSKFESGSYQMNLKPVCIQDVCMMSLKSLEVKAPKNVEISTDFDKGKIILSTDAQRIQQLLVNLLTNAYKYTEQGRIIVSCHERMQGQNERMPNQQVVVIAVSDTGPGIQPDMAEQVFNRFEKLNSFKQGTGLGLSICRQIANLLGGEIYVDTSYDKGARFVFLHPVV